MDERRCVICGGFFEPEPRARLQQKCCGKKCSKKLKRRRDRVHKQHYRKKDQGKKQRRRENEAQRDRLGWNEYMRLWRKADPRKRTRQERERAKRYYLKHKEKILQKLRSKRAANLCLKNRSKN